MASRIRKLVWAGLGVATGAVVISSRKRHKYTLDDKVVLIAGGSRGLGLVLAREFSRRGCKVAVCARNEDELARVRDEFALMNERFLALPCDLRNQDAVAELIKTVEDKFGHIDLLINNAGTIQVGPLENQNIEDFREAMETNFWSAVHTTLAVYPHMQARKSGRIVNITSIGGKVAVPHLVPYSASKFALIGFSKGTRAELKKDGIAVTTVIPGLMRTGSPRNINTTGKHRLEYSWFMLSDSMPGMSMSAQSAARKIVRACLKGSGEVVLGAPAKVIAAAEALAPNAFDSLLAATNEWVLPDPTAGDGKKKKGFQSESSWTNPLVTRLTRKAERQNNQISQSQSQQQAPSAARLQVASPSESRFGHASTAGAESFREPGKAPARIAVMSPQDTPDTNDRKQAAIVLEDRHVETQSGKTPGEAAEQAALQGKQELANKEVLDNPADKSVRPVEPQCRKCGRTFSTEAELVEHAATCKGGNEPEVHPHFH